MRVILPKAVLRKQIVPCSWHWLLAWQKASADRGTCHGTVVSRLQCALPGAALNLSRACVTLLIPLHDPVPTLCQPSDHLKRLLDLLIRLAHAYNVLPATALYTLPSFDSQMRGIRLQIERVSWHIVECRWPGLWRSFLRGSCT